jgi:deoxycytidine triphosphate deaminase
LINTALLTTVRDSRIPSLPCLPSLFCPRWIPKTLYSSWDPFPEIAPALLNSADISDYVRVTGMIYPFYKEKLKSASYPVAILGKLIYWDDEEKECQMDLQKGDYFTLKSNSIAFVTLEPMFRIPNYIALRFNFKITNVYRGILLGTGPLVDPGFVGKLSIPLHNLTSNDYLFKGGEDLIISRVNSPPLGAHEKSKKELQYPAACGGAVYFGWNLQNLVEIMNGIKKYQRMTSVLIIGRVNILPFHLTKLRTIYLMF